jgi:hypothetical protein
MNHTVKSLVSRLTPKLSASDKPPETPSDDHVKKVYTNLITTIHTNPKAKAKWEEIRHAITQAAKHSLESRSVTTAMLNDVLPMIFHASEAGVVKTMRKQNKVPRLLKSAEFLACVAYHLDGEPTPSRAARPSGKPAEKPGLESQLDADVPVLTPTGAGQHWDVWDGLAKQNYRVETVDTKAVEQPNGATTWRVLWVTGPSKGRAATVALKHFRKRVKKPSKAAKKAAKKEAKTSVTLTPAPPAKTAKPKPAKKAKGPTNAQLKGQLREARKTLDMTTQEFNTHVVYPAQDGGTRSLASLTKAQLIRGMELVAFLTAAAKEQEAAQAVATPPAAPAKPAKAPQPPKVTPAEKEASQEPETTPRPRYISEVDPWPNATPDEWEARYLELPEHEARELLAEIEACEPDPEHEGQDEVRRSSIRAQLDPSDDDDPCVVEEAIDAITAGHVEVHEVDKCSCGRGLIAEYESLETGEPLCEDCAHLAEAVGVEPKQEWDVVEAEVEWSNRPPDDAPLACKLSYVTQNHLSLCAANPGMTPLDGVVVAIYDPETMEAAFYGRVESAWCWVSLQPPCKSPLLINSRSWTHERDRADNTRGKVLAQWGLTMKSAS